MIERLPFLLPEITLFITASVVMLIGLSKHSPTRRAVNLVTSAGLALASVLAVAQAMEPASLYPALAGYGKTLIGVVALMLTPLLAGAVDHEHERAVDGGEAFRALRATRGEFHAFFLFAVLGSMLVLEARDLVWLFLALELSSLPTYIMVAISRDRDRAREAAVKYFFLGALGAAVFLYGFALLYGATGSTDFREIQAALAAQAAGGGLSPLAVGGLVLATLGLLFKLSGVPMHFAVADVYEGASASVAAVLAFLPKAAGLMALIMVLGLVGWGFGVGEGGRLPAALHYTLWLVAAASMIGGNAMALAQTSVRRILAYSGVAHSGYMLAGLLVGGAGVGARFVDSGVAASLLYIVTYAVASVAAFGALACVRTAEGDSPDRVDDLRGLLRVHPVAGGAFALAMLSLLGVPPLLGVFGKLGLLMALIGGGQWVLAVVLVVASALGAAYYLRLFAVVCLERPTGVEPLARHGSFFPRVQACWTGGAGLVLLLAGLAPLAAASSSASLRSTPVFDAAAYIEAQRSGTGVADVEQEFEAFLRAIEDLPAAEQERRINGFLRERGISP